MFSHLSSHVSLTIAYEVSKGGVLLPRFYRKPQVRHLMCVSQCHRTKKCKGVDLAPASAIALGSRGECALPGRRGGRGLDHGEVCIFCHWLCLCLPRMRPFRQVCLLAKCCMPCAI